MDGKSPPGTIHDLEGMTLDEYHRTSLYLIKHGLAEGHFFKGGGYRAWANHVTGSGMDIIEKFIDTSIEQIEEKKISFLGKSSSYVQKFIELMTIWSKNSDLLNQAWDTFMILIESAV